MSRLTVHSGLATLAIAVALLGPGTPGDVAAARRASADKPAKRTRDHDREERPAFVAPRSDTLAQHHQPADEDWVLLGKATVAARAGDLRGVVESLEALDPASEPTWSEADRAAFLLGQAYLGLGAVERFRTLARAVSGWDWESPYTRWLVFQLGQLETEARGDSLAGAAGDSAVATIANGSALSAYLEAHRQPNNGVAWDRVVQADTTTTLGRDLAGAALIRRATSQLEAGNDPSPMLGRVPAGSRYAARARHVLALATLEHGDSTRGEAMLRALADDESTYAARREVLLALGGRALDRGEWTSAFGTYRTIERDWNAERDTLERLLASGRFEPLWNAWRSDPALSGAVLLDAAVPESTAARLAARSLDLDTRPTVDIARPDAPAHGEPFRWAVAAPPPEAWRSLAASARALGETRGELERTRWGIARERESLDTLRRYLGI